MWGFINVKKEQGKTEEDGRKMTHLYLAIWLILQGVRIWIGLSRPEGLQRKKKKHAEAYSAYNSKQCILFVS